MSLRNTAALALVAVVALLAAALLRPPAVEAHAVLVRSFPASQSQLLDPPSALDLWFSEPLEAGFSTFELFASDASPLPVDGIRVDPADQQHLSGLLRRLDPGVYTIVYRTLSTRDGHEWSGSLTFTVLNPDGYVPPASAYNPDIGSGTSPAQVAGRWFVFTAFSVLLGAGLISLLAARAAGTYHAGFARTVRRLGIRLGIAALPLAVAGSLLQLISQHQALGGSLTTLLSESRFGMLLLWRALAILAIGMTLLLALLAAHRRRDRTERLLSTLATALAAAGLITISLLSHAAAAPGTFWAVAVDLVHLELAALWVGGLITLAALLVRLRATEASPHVPLSRLLGTFSMFAAVTLYLLAATGTVRSLGELPTPGALIDTAYGRWLIAKLVLIAPLLGVALLNRELLYRWSRGKVAEPVARRRLLRLLPAEAALATAVLLSVAILGQVPTPRGNVAPPEAAAIFGSYNRIERVNDLTVHLQVTPAGVGPNELRVHLYRSDGSAPGLVERVQLTLGAPGAGGGDELLGTPEGDGIYTATGSFSSLARAWDVAVDVRRADFDDARVGFEVPIEINALGVEGPTSFGSPAPQLRTNFVWAIVLVIAGIGLLLFEPARRSLVGSAMRVSGIGAVVIAMIFAVTAWQADDSGLILENPSVGDPQALVRGAALYQANCVSCHGAAGAGDGPLALALVTPPADLVYHVPLHSETETYIFISDGFPDTGMPAWSDDLTSSEIWDVVNFLRDEFGDLSSSQQ